MGLGPIPAVKKVLEQAGMTIDDIDVLELNEAFAAQVVPCRDEWGIDHEKLNPFGGAIALGHPFGMTGARIMTTLLNDLDTLDGTIGLETMCVAGGMGQAMIVERLNRAHRPELSLEGSGLVEVARGTSRASPQRPPPPRGGGGVRRGDRPRPRGRRHPVLARRESRDHCVRAKVAYFGPYTVLN